MDEIIKVSPSKNESVSCSVMSDSLQPHGCSWPSSALHGVLQAGVLEWVGVPFSRDLPNPGVEPRSPILQADFLLPESPGKPIYIGVYLYSFLILSHYGLL